MNNIFYLDFFGEDTSFIVRGKKYYRTWCGVILSILLIIASVILTFLFGQEVYQRKKPNISISEEFMSTSLVKMTDFPYYMVLRDKFGRIIENANSYFDIKTFKMNLTDKGVVEYSDYTSFHPVVKCTSKNFDTIRGKISDSIIEDILIYPTLCVNYDDEGILHNPYTSKNSTFLNIDLFICNKTERTCADDIDDTTKEVYLQLYLLNSYVDSNDYSNPIKYYFESNAIKITSVFFKRIYISVLNNEYISDDGWILENIRRISYYNIKELKNEISSIPPYNSLLVLRNTFDSPLLRRVTNRSYLKVQDLFANVGGIVNAFMIIINMIFTHYFRYNFNMNLRKYLNPSNNEYKDRRKLNLLNISNNNFIQDNSNVILNKNIKNSKEEQKEVEDNIDRIDKIARINNLNKEDITDNNKVNMNKSTISKACDNISNHNFTLSNDISNTDANKGLLFRNIKKNENIAINKNKKAIDISLDPNKSNISNSINPFNPKKNQTLTNNYIKPLFDSRQINECQENKNDNFEILQNKIKELNTHSPINNHLMMMIIIIEYLILDILILVNLIT